MQTKDYHDEELLHRWTTGELTAPEEAELERRSQQDAGLLQAWSALRATPAEDHGGRVRRMVARSANRRGEPAVPRTRRFRPRYVTYAVAASLAMLLGLSVWLLPDYLSTDSEVDLAMDRSAPRPPVATAPLPTLPPPAAPPPSSSSPAPAVAPSSPAPDRQVAVVEPTAEPEEVVDEDLEREAMQEEAPPAVAPTLPAPAPLPPAPAAAAAAVLLPPPLEGTVTDEAGNPIVGALVLRPGQALGVRTDSSGRFVLDRDLTLRELTVQAAGYEAETVEVFEQEDALQLSLTALPQPTPADLFAENAARARINLEPKRREPTRAEPTEGYRELRQRIEEGQPENVPPGRVRVSFLVNPDGTLSDFRFRGRPDRATMDYVGETLVESSAWQVVGQSRPVRVYLKLRFE